ncbi:MAG TPA: PQQ-dependent sugar dehydrogenase [Hyphomonadaceae bacterium]|jgi:glucose/arabinose dehydrogenase|nr:PQQ-dependent sugar dehydrogenase [Hyphomonadaceae bacterium]
MRAGLVSSLALALTLLACKPNDDQAATAQAPSAPGAPVEQGAPNKKDAVPAFAGQTRAPEMRSNVRLKVETVVDGIDHPWGSALLPDGSLLVTSKQGKLWLVKPQQGKTEVTGVLPVDNRGQGGLLDISLSPDFATSRKIYFSFSEPRGNDANGTSLAVATLSADATKLEGAKVIFQQTPSWKSTGHFGSNIEWDRSGNIYLTMGERQQYEPQQLAQDLNAFMGKVVRLKPDGSPADGNPFIGRSDAKPEIWSYGHRNVQGAAINPDTGKLWTIEHGPRGGDEINIPQAGKNYGWPIICYCIDYPGGPIGEGITAKEGMEQPIYYFDPVIAPGDMIFYRGNLFPWKGNILASALGGSAIVRLVLDGEKVIGEERLLKDQGRIRDITEAADGSLYVLVDDTGKVLRLTPAP